nr:NAD(P)/FAD-dependent oxidoreductase [Polymorphobacter sp.]
MNVAVAVDANAAAEVEHFDVLVVGAGISGIGAAWHLTHQRPGTSFVVLESQGGYGGTWLSHKFPGIRSDSDLYTFGYRFKPWVGPPIATGAEIQAYLGAVIDESDLGQHIRYGHRILSSDWSSADKRWTIVAARTDTGEQRRFTANFLWMCQGYYRHNQGFTPEWAGMADFKGTIVHTEEWPEDLDYSGKRVVVIGSGATAATIIPAMAPTAAKVTMLQRSPTYFLSNSNENELADTLRALQVDDAWTHEIVRRKLNWDMAEITRRSFEEPEVMRDELIEAVRALLPPDYDVATHFTPRYLPWRQRIAMVPDGDLFAAISAGTADVVTGQIASFTPDGIRLESGETVPADIIVTATGFNLSVLGDIDFSIDGEPLDFSETVTYRGMMFTGVPNMVWVFGYLRASWTLRADLIGDFVCKMLGHMEAKGAREVVPALRPEDHNMPRLPWIDPDNFNAGYVQRGVHLLPKRGDKPEWQHTQDYWAEKDSLPLIDLDDAAFVYR